jgi:hypothetical protein
LQKIQAQAQAKALAQAQAQAQALAQAQAQVVQQATQVMHQQAYQQALQHYHTQKNALAQQQSLQQAAQHQATQTHAPLTQQQHAYQQALLAQQNHTTPTIPITIPDVLNQPSIPLPSSDPDTDLAAQVKMLSQQMLDIQLVKAKKAYSQNDLCPYPFNDSIAYIPFPVGFEIPKFDKYKGTTNPIDHIREFYVHCIDVGKNNALLIRLFPWSLSGAAMEWFSRLPSSLTQFQDIVDLFINHFPFNMDMDVSLQDLNGLKQACGEVFAKFLQ